jgi:hypothetical protein
MVLQALGFERMVRHAVILLALLGQVLPPVACARCCWPPEPAADAEAEGCCPCCIGNEQEESQPSGREGPHAPTCPVNPDHHLVAWSHASPVVAFDAAAPPAAPPESVVHLEGTDLAFAHASSSPGTANSHLAVPLRC